MTKKENNMIEFKIGEEKFDDLYLIYEYEDDEPEVEVLFDGELLLTVSYDEAQELSELTDQQLERGAEYCREIHRCFDAWQAAEDNYAFENNKDAITAYVKESVSIDEQYHNHVDWKSMWDQDFRYDFSETDNYVFHNR